ncbi:MAG TPA: SdrD B-like domain-containing protein, partial [Candidatus Dormibacteraeota bacterium]|nr:SdrD B-like domain-containing protein [Candidatus Dormibacteraeota bacterium]
MIITHAALAITKTVLSPTNGTIVIGSNAVFRIVVQNIGDTPITTLPLEDGFSATCYQFISATVPPDGIGAGSLLWNNLAGSPLPPSGSIIIDITLRAVGGCDPANNTAHVDYAVDANGNPVPPVSSTVGLVAAASKISGTVYNDPDQSGTLTPGDSGLSGVTIQLYSDPNRDGNPSDGAILAVTTTDAAGYYELLNLSTGAYVVVESDLPGYASTAPLNNRLPVTINTLSTNANYNFFDYLPNPVVYATIGGTVWNDANTNGIADGGEVGIANITIDLIQDLNTNGFAEAGEPVAASTITDTNGAYVFQNVTPGHYVVRETDAFGWL